VIDRGNPKVTLISHRDWHVTVAPFCCPGTFGLACGLGVQVTCKKAAAAPGSDSSPGRGQQPVTYGPGLSLPVPWRLPTRRTAAAQNGRQRRLE
jgi:hypothetical protein